MISVVSRLRMLSFVDSPSMYRAVEYTTMEFATRTSPGIGHPFCSGDKVYVGR